MALRAAAPSIGVLAVLLLSCAPAQVPQSPRPRSEMVVTTEWLASRLGEPGVVVLHIAGARSGREEYDAGHIPGARFVGWSDIAVPRDGVPNEIPPAEMLVALAERVGIGPTGRIVVYDGETGLTAARAFVVLDYLGLGERTSLLDGQLRKWKGEARPLSTEATEGKPASFVPHLRPEVIVSLQAMRDFSWIKERHPGAPFELIDARPEAHFTGAEGPEGISQPGHIPGAVSLYWVKHLAGTDNPVLKPIPELRALYEAAGVEPGETVVAYCRTGVQASHSYFVAKYLGYEARLYDGSLVEWSSGGDASSSSSSLARSEVGRSQE